MFEGFAVACIAVLLATVSSAGAAVRDDTDWLQAKLDAGGSVFLPRLPDGQCYATRGLWVSRDDTSITSDGACIVALGPGPGRIRRGDGTPVLANAVFFLNHCNVDRIWEAWMQQHGRVYVPDQSAPKSLKGHRIDDQLSSLISPSTTPAAVLDVFAQYEYDSLDV